MPSLIWRPCQCCLLCVLEQSRDLICQPGTKLTYKERCRIFTLSDLLHWTPEAIATAMGLARTTVQSVIKSKVEAHMKQTGRKPAIMGDIQECLIAHATFDAAHCRMTFKEIARLEGVQAGRKALVAAFKMESYGRRVATSKPLLTQ